MFVNVIHLNREEVYIVPGISCMFENPFYAFFLMYTVWWKLWNELKKIQISFTFYFFQKNGFLHIATWMSGGELTSVNVFVRPLAPGKKKKKMYFKIIYDIQWIFYFSKSYQYCMDAYIFLLFLLGGKMFSVKEIWASHDKELNLKIWIVS